MKKIDALILAVALFLLLFPFEAHYLTRNWMALNMIAACCWFTLGLIIVVVWYQRVILKSSMSNVTKILLLIIALLLLLYHPIITVYIIWLKWSHPGLGVIIASPIWFWLALGILIVATWLNKGSKKNVVEAKQ